MQSALQSDPHYRRGPDVNTSAVDLDQRGRRRQHRQSLPRVARRRASGCPAVQGPEPGGGCHRPQSAALLLRGHRRNRPARRRQQLHRGPRRPAPGLPGLARPAAGTALPVPRDDLHRGHPDRARRAPQPAPRRAQPRHREPAPDAGLQYSRRRRGSHRGDGRRQVHHRRRAWLVRRTRQRDGAPRLHHGLPHHPGEPRRRPPRLQHQHPGRRATSWWSSTCGAPSSRSSSPPKPPSRPAPRSLPSATCAAAAWPRPRDHLLVVASEGISFFQSVTAANSLVYGLLAGMEAAHPERSRAAIRRTQQLWKDLDIYLD